MAEQTVKVRKGLSANAKKVIVLCSMVALLVLTGVLNFVLNGDLINPAQDSTSVDGDAVTTFFSNYRTDRETARAEEMSYLDAIISSEDSSAEAKATAEEMKQELLGNIEAELVIENLIKAKGFDDAIVTMSTDNVNVIVNLPQLEQEQVSQILGIVLGETDYAATQVVVVPYEA